MATFYIIPHTHWEGAVFKTREQYLPIGLPHLLQALYLLGQYPTYRFILDQACYLQPLLERYPAVLADVRRYVAEGRLVIVGGTDTMLDVNMPGGESFIRQVLYGKGYVRRMLGVEVTVGWQLDTFGHHAQMPQLLCQAGFTTFWFARGVPSPATPAEFLWEGLDGSRIPAFWLPHSYGYGYGSPTTLPEFAEFFRARYAGLDPFMPAGDRVALAGVDVCPPEPHLAPLTEESNAQQATPFRLRLASPEEYAAAVRDRTERTVLRGELNPIFQGIYSSRIELKQQMREIEHLLLTAEKLGALLRATGTAVDDDLLWRAWEPVLFNQAHDLMSGVMTDHVYTDTLRSLDFAQRLAAEEVTARLHALSERVATDGEGIPVVVFNPLGWARRDVVTAQLGFASGEGVGIELRDPDGHTVPVQFLDATRNPNGTLLTAEIAFLADVPALGYAVYRALPSATRAQATIAVDGVLENDLYRIECDPHTGAMTRLWLKTARRELLAGAANVLACEEDHGDFWELYRPLNACSNIGMTDRHPAPPRDGAAWSDAEAAVPGTVTHGPVLSEFAVAHPFGSGAFSTRIRLYAGLRRIDIRTTLVNREEAVRYRVLFPTAIAGAQPVGEIPFGALARPEGVEYPAQQWIDWSDGAQGLALLNRGLPGNNVADNTLLLSLARSTRIVAYGYGGGYEPGMSSDTGLELGNLLTFDYALVPHQGNWQQAGIYRDGYEFNHPLLAATVAPHPGTLPTRWGLLHIAPAQVVLSALKQGQEGHIILRVYEATGQPAPDTTVTTALPLRAAAETDVLEQETKPLDVAGHTITFDLGPFEIKTISVRFAG